MGWEALLWVFRLYMTQESSKSGQPWGKLPQFEGVIHDDTPPTHTTPATLSDGDIHLSKTTLPHAKRPYLRPRLLSQHDHLFPSCTHHSIRSNTKIDGNQSPIDSNQMASVYSSISR